MERTSALAVLVGLALVGCRPPVEESVAIRPVRAVKIADTDQLEARWFPGRAKATQEVNVAFEVAGRIIERPVDVGDRVEKGDLLARLDPSDFQNELAAAKAQRDQVRRDALARWVTAASKSVELVKTLYRTGLTDFQNVRDMESTLTFQQDEYAASEGQVVQNLIELYRALGGGWKPDPPELADELADQQENGEPVL